MADRGKRSLVIIAIALTSFVIIHPLIALPSWYHSHEGIRYLYLMEKFRSIFESGTLYPRWMPDLLGGYGYPEFLFYQPGVFYFLLPFTYLPITMPHAFMAALFTAFFISGIGAYRLARLFGNDRFLSTLFTGCYLFMPYIYINLYIRGDLSELLAMLACPWVMYGMFRIRQEAAFGQAALSSFLTYALSAAIVFFTHPFVALFLAAILGWFILTDFLIHGFRRPFSYVLILGVAIAATLTAPYWLTVLQLSPYVALRRLSIYPSSYLPLAQVLSDAPAPWPVNIGTIGVISSFYLCLAISGLIAIRRKSLCWQLLPLLFLCVFMNTPQSHPLWHWLFPVKYTKFPWRIGSVGAVIQYISILQLSVLRRRFSAAGLRVVLALLVVAGTVFQIYLPPSGNWEKLRIGIARRFTASLDPLNAGAPIRRAIMAGGTRDIGEFTPHWAHKRWLFSHSFNAPIRASSGALSILDNELQPFHIHAHYDLTPRDFADISPNPVNQPYITIHQVYFPGWKVLVNRQPLAPGDIPSAVSPSLAMDNGGRMLVLFPHPGAYDIEAWYDGPPGWQWRNICMLLELAALWSAGIWYGFLPSFPGRLKYLRLTAWIHHWRGRKSGEAYQE